MKQRPTFVIATLGLALSACVATNPDIPRGHPAHPASPTTPIELAPVLTTVAASVSHAPHTHADSAGAAEVWSCPMHAEVVRTGPGKCPICGMNLVKQPAGKGTH